MIQKERTYFQPHSAEEAVNIAHKHENESCFIAGGTDVMVNKFQGNNEFSCFIDITGISEMKQISVQDNYLKIGSLVTLDNITKHTQIKNNFPLLIQAANAIASPVIRKTATVGGNLLCENRCVYYNQSTWWREAVGHCLKCDGDICIATGGKKNCFSKFVSDLAVALICMDSNIEVVEHGGSYIAPLENLYSGDGVNPHKLKKSTLIKYIHIPLQQDFRFAFKKLRQRESMEFSSLTTAVTRNKHGKIKIVLGGVDPRPVVVEGTHGNNEQDLIKQAVKKTRIVDNDVFSRQYRKDMISVFLNQSFQEIAV